MVQLHVQRTIAAPRERVFDWLAAPANLAVAPLVVRAHYAKGSSAPGVGAVREVIGVGAFFREEITAYDAPWSYSYRILRAFPAFDHEGGTLTFTPVASVPFASPQLHLPVHSREREIAALIGAGLSNREIVDRLVSSARSAAGRVYRSSDHTHVDWVSTYTHPNRSGGKVMEVVSSRLLRSSFRAILAGCAKALET